MAEYYNTMKDMITVCALCGTGLKKVLKEKKGVYTNMMSCPKCGESYLTLKQHEKIYTEFYSKAFMSGNSLAVRIPRKIAEKVGLKKGSSFHMRVRNKKIIIEAIA